MHSDFGRLGVSTNQRAFHAVCCQIAACFLICLSVNVRNFRRSEHSAVEICTQKGGQRPLIGSKSNTMHNLELCTNQRTLHLDCFQISADFAIWVSPKIFPNFSRSEDSAAAAAAANEMYALLLLMMMLLLLLLLQLKNLRRARELL